MHCNVFTHAERPDLQAHVSRINGEAWAEFALHDPVARSFWGELTTTFSPYQVILVSKEDEVVAFGNTIPFYWDATVEGLPAGWDGVLEAGCIGHRDGVKPNTLSALAAAVAPEYRGRGISKDVLLAMKAVASHHGLTNFVAPVRPSMKGRYPLTPMERYLTWSLPGGRPFDPWIRVHHDLGATVLAIADPSMTIPGTVAEWEEWTDMAFPESGRYVVPEALRPVDINREEDRGVYREPNVWMRHIVAP